VRFLWYGLIRTQSGASKMINDNPVEMLKEDLRRNLASAVIDSIVDDMVAEFKAKAKEIVFEHVKDVSLERLELFRNLNNCRDEIELFINGVNAKKGA
jgi:hypothetical protein